MNQISKKKKKKIYELKIIIHLLVDLLIRDMILWYFLSINKKKMKNVFLIYYFLFKKFVFALRV